MKQKGDFKGKECVEVVREEKADGQFGGRTLCVSVQKVKPIFSDPQGGQDKKGPAQIDVVISRGDRAKITVTADEAKSLHEMLGYVVEEAKAVDDKCRSEKEAWRRRRGEGGGNGKDMYQPKSGGDFSMGRGKTARNKKKGKAGAAAHQRRKAERSAKERQRQADMGHVKKGK